MREAMNADIATTRDDIHLGPRLLLLIEPQTRRHFHRHIIALLYGSLESSAVQPLASIWEYFDARMSILGYRLRRRWV